MQNLQDITIGDQIQLKHPYHNDLRGEVRFIGEVKGLRYLTDKYFGNVWYGIELYTKISTANNGSIDNIAYFKCKPNHGVFVKRDIIDKIIKINYDVPRITINDKISIATYKCDGIIRYIGIPECEATIFYGLQLLERRGDNDGTFNKRKYFAYCQHDHGIFLSQFDNSLCYLYKSSPSNMTIHGFAERHISNDIIKIIISYIDHIDIRVSSRDHETKIKRKMRFDVYDRFNNHIGPSIIMYKWDNEICQTMIGNKYLFTKNSVFGRDEIQIFENKEWKDIMPTNTNKLRMIIENIAKEYNASIHELKVAFQENCIYGFQCM